MEVVCINNIEKENKTVPLTIGKHYHIKYGYVVDQIDKEVEGYQLNLVKDNSYKLKKIADKRKNPLVKKEIQQGDKVIYYFLLNPDTDVVLFSPRNFVTLDEWRQMQLDKII
jgi:hypothetical protein